MTYFVYLLAALAIGGGLGTLLNITASRLPADVPLFGPPLSSGSAEPFRRGIVPWFGAYDPRRGQIDWPCLGTQLAMAALVFGALAIHGAGVTTFQVVVLGAILLLILRLDWQHHLIFVLTVWPGILIALGFHAGRSWADFLSALIAGIAAAGAFLLLYFLAILIYRKRALGFGDVLLAGLIGTIVGLQFVAVTLLFGMVLAALGGLFLILIRVRKRTDYIPYGAYLSFAAIVMVLLVS
jgi:leader peptidase (prepilin peptidase)/N-methyltransferase